MDTVNEISAAYWRHGELFFTTIVPIMMIAAGILVMVMIFALIYHYYRYSKQVALLAGVLIVGLLGAYWGIANYYQTFETLNRGVMPNIRDREKVFVGYKYYDDDTLASFRRIQNRAGIEALGIYEKEPATEAVEYLGQAHDSFYFKFRGQILYLRDHATFAEQDVAELVGVRYQLSRSEFADIGFFQTTNDFLDELVIPEKWQARTYESVDGVIPKSFTGNQSVWATHAEEN